MACYPPRVINNCGLSSCAIIVNGLRVHVQKIFETVHGIHPDTTRTEAIQVNTNRNANCGDCHILELACHSSAIECSQTQADALCEPPCRFAKFTNDMIPPYFDGGCPIDSAESKHWVSNQSTNHIHLVCLCQFQEELKRSSIRTMQKWPSVSLSSSQLHSKALQ